MSTTDTVDPVVEPPVDPVVEPITTDAPATTEAPDAPAPAPDVAAVAGADVTPLPVTERRSFGRASADEPMPVTQHTGV